MLEMAVNKLNLIFRRSKKTKLEKFLKQKIIDACPPLKEDTAHFLETSVNCLNKALEKEGIDHTQVKVTQDGFFIKDDPLPEGVDSEIAVQAGSVKKFLTGFLGVRILHDFEIRVAKCPEHCLHILVCDDSKWGGVAAQLVYFWFFNRIKLARTIHGNGILSLAY